MESTLIDIIVLATKIITILLVARAVVSWVAPQSTHPIVMFIYKATEPVLAPVRNLLPETGGMDFSPMVVLIGVQVLQSFLIRALA